MAKMQVQNTVVLEEAQRDHFTMIPNIVFDMGLGPHSIALYAHLRRIAGESGVCWRSTHTLARETGISVGQVSKSKRILEEAGLIHIAEEPCPGGIRHVITITDIWAVNHQYFVPNTQRSPGEAQRSPGEAQRSPGELKKITIRRSPEEDDYADRIDDVSVSYCEPQKSHDLAATNASNSIPAAPNGAGGSAAQPHEILPEPKPKPESAQKPKPKTDSMLLPQTREERVLFGQLQEAARAAGRRGPQRFQTPQQAEAFREAAAHLNGRTEAIIKAAVVRGITTLAGVVNYVAGAARNARAESAGETYGGVPVMRPVQVQIQED